MTETLLSREARITWLQDQIGDLEKFGDFPDEGVIAGSIPRSAGALRSFIESAAPGELDAIARQLNVAEDRGATRRRREQEEAEREQQRAERQRPLTEQDPEFQEVRASEARAKAAFEYARSTEGRLEKIEGLLGEIRDSLAPRTR